MRLRHNVERRTSNFQRRIEASFEVRRSTFDIRRSSGTSASRRGLSLFEVIIALAIFTGSIAAIGQLVSTGVRGAVQARLQSQAMLRAETKMAEVVAGITALYGGSTGIFPDDKSWTWSIAVAAGTHEGLYIVEVTAAHPSATKIGNQSYALRRLVRDPKLQLDAYEKQQEAAANGSTATGSSTGSPSGSSTSGGSK